MQRRIFMLTGIAGVAGPGWPEHPSAQAQQVTWEDITGPDNRYRLKLPLGYRYLTCPRTPAR